MDPVAAFAAEINKKIQANRTATSRGVVTAVSGGEVTFDIGAGMEMVGRWVGATAPAVGEVVTFLDEGRGYPLVFGATGRDSLASLYRFTSFTPVWTGTGGHPILGNGSLTGRFFMATDWCYVEIAMKAGSTTDFGIGNHAFSLPATGVAQGDYHVLQGVLFDQSTARIYPLQGMIPAGQTVVYPVYNYILEDTLGGAIGHNWVTATSPITLADADSIHLKGIYRFQ